MPNLDVKIYLFIYFETIISHNAFDNFLQLLLDLTMFFPTSYPSYPPFLSLFLSHLYSLLPSESSQCLLCVHGYRAIHQSVGNLLKATLLKKPDFPSSNSHQLPTARLGWEELFTNRKEGKQICEPRVPRDNYLLLLLQQIMHRHPQTPRHV